jgi:patatin-like phospholipase/acyl hydrolase
MNIYLGFGCCHSVCTHCVIRCRLIYATDGGGIRGLSELVILREIMRRIQHDEKLKTMPRPCDYFDLIGGTSTGGLIAIMLGRLRLSADDAIEAYRKFAEHVFSEKKWKGRDGTFKASKLEDAIKNIVAESEDKDAQARMLDPRLVEESCKA